MNLDLETLYFTNTLIRVTCIVVFAIFVFRDKTDKYRQHWLAALAASTVGMFLLLSGFEAVPINTLFIIAVYLTFVLSQAWSWTGLRAFYGRSWSPAMVTGLVLVPALVYGAAVSIGLPQRQGLSALYIVLGLWAIAATFEICRPTGERLLSEFIIAFSWGFYGLSLFTASVVLFRGTGAIDLTDSIQIPIIFDVVGCIVIYYGYMTLAAERANLRLEVLASTDPLTGLHNRRGGMDRLAQLTADSRQEHPVSVVVCDIDHFKTINDELGHESGDIVLHGVGQQVRAIVSTWPAATGVRWGGEEFLVIVPDTPLSSAEVLAERLRRTIEAERVLIGGRSVGVTLSLGVAEAPAGERDVTLALQRADRALYRAKAQGRNCTCVETVCT